MNDACSDLCKNTMNRLLFVTAALTLLVSCSSESGSAEKVVLKAPSDVVAAQSSKSSVKLTWKDNSDGETGFSVFMTQDKADVSDRVGFTVENATSYSVTKGLADGESYYFGVRADGAGSKENSEIVWSDLFTLVDPDRPQVILQETVKSLPASVVLKYSFANLDKTSNPSCGICWNLEGNPTIEDMHQDGPVLALTSTGEMQAISNVLLDYGKEYTFRAYLKSGKSIWYSNPVKGSLGKEPEAITFNWTRVSTPTISPDIEVYTTSDNLNGRVFNAWYAIADVTKGNVEFRVCVPDKLTTVDKQYNDNQPDCQLLVNAAYFYGNYNIGVSVVNGVMHGNINPLQGSLDKKNEPEEYETYYEATRGIFGTDESGKPKSCWVGTNGQNYFYDRPLPSIKGESKYAKVSTSMPAKNISWSPKYAVTGGPVLLYDGKCPFDFELTDKGEQYYYDNFEIIPYDLYGPGIVPDRTAAGMTADGKIIIFVCDGRIKTSRGALITELAMIMKGLGCVSAVNFDGGGSTTMICEGKRLNSEISNWAGDKTENRAVKSTMGFFTKR